MAMAQQSKHTHTMSSKQIGSEALRSIYQIMHFSGEELCALSKDELVDAIESMKSKVTALQRDVVRQKRTIEAKSTIIEHQQLTQRKMIADAVEQLKGVR